MVPLVIEGSTLGQKHRNYNKVANEIKQEVVQDINYEEPDLDNLLKIDIACRNRNVDYIIKVLQCEDMLYVSRAIKRSTWLITDPQYANIINPTYLNDQLSPNMMSKAFNKLLLHIRLNLKDEKRVEEFFNYYEEVDLQAAFKWLPNCSIQLMEEIIRKHAQDIPDHIARRLSEKSITCLELYVRNSGSYYKHDILAATKFLLNNNMEKYLDIIEACQSYQVPKFGPKATKLIMRKCSGRVMKNLEKYSSFIHVPTFAKFIKQEDIKDFITKNIKNKNMRSWFSYSNIKPFINRLPIENRFEIVKEISIENNEAKEDDILEDDVFYYCSAGNECNTQNTYRWYTYAPFNVAFVDLKKLIRSESKSAERTSMFGVMLTCAGKDMKNIHTLLKYYREHHINEPFKFKVQFVNLVISYKNTHRFDKETWGYLNDLFSSMDVYRESEKVDQNCVRSIILYNIMHEESIPDIIEKKFIFTTFKDNQKKFSEEEKEKVFLYLYKYLESKFDLKFLKINDEKEFGESLEVLKKMLNLLVDWNKELKDFPKILDKVKEIIKIAQKNKWSEDVSSLYNVKKSWRKLLFEESIVLNPTQEACINALKHGPEILDTYKKEVESLCLNDNILIDRFLKKLRIYWSESLANTYREFFANKIDQKNARKEIDGLCILLPKNDFLNLVQKYVPSEAKIDWSQPDDVELNLSKYIASSMHFARPQPSPDVVLLYAKGDYLQFALPALNSILHNMSSVQTRKYLAQMLNSPVSLQKHGIRTAFSKLKHDELKKTFSDIWKTNKNSSIRAAIFNQTLDFLCKQNEPSAIKEMWELLSVFIDNLTPEEDKSIYNKLSKTDKVPMSVRPEFWMKSYKFLKSLPAKANCDGHLNRLKNNMNEVMEFLDNDFVAGIFFESFDKNFSTQRYDYQYKVVDFVLSTRTEEAHIARYNKIFVPILEQAFAMWNKTHEGTNYVRINLKETLLVLDSRIEDIVLNKKMILPIPMYTDILKRLDENLSLEDNYVLITTRKLSLDCVKTFNRVLKTNEILAKKISESTEDDRYKPLYTETAAELGKIYVNYLKEDVANNFPSIFILFARSFKSVFEKFEFSLINKMNVLKPFLESDDFIEGYLFVLTILKNYGYEDDEKALKTELLNRISKHPSKEVKMHYNYCNSLD